MISQRFIIGLLTLVLLGSALDAHAAPPFQEGVRVPVQGPRKFIVHKRVSRRNIVSDTREREHMFFEVSVERTRNGVRNRQSIKQLNEHLKRY